ncbi:hypothetical protein Tco_0633235 [Tanacetum coccineum]
MQYLFRTAATGMFGYYCNLQQGCLDTAVTCSKGVWILLQLTAGVFGYCCNLQQGVFGYYCNLQQGCLDTAVTCSKGVWILLQLTAWVFGFAMFSSEDDKDLAREMEL